MKVIVDCDSGNDDAWAIVSLLRAEEKSNYKVIAITCVNGNTTVDHSARNNLLILETLGRLDVPVYKGAESALIKNTEQLEQFHGIDGFGMIYNEKPSDDLIQKKHAVLAIKDYIDENSNDVTILALGPLTNIAMLYKLFPGISKKFSNLYIMGGNHLGVGNVTKAAEFNFWSDPEATHIVFTETECPIYIFPWEPCIEAGLSMPFEDWRIAKLASNKNPFTNLLDPVETKAYRNVLPRWTPCDNFLACCFIYPKMIEKMTKHHVTIELAGNHTRGQMVIDHLLRSKPNAFLIEKIDVEMFKRFMLWVCDHPDSNFEF